MCETERGETLVLYYCILCSKLLARFPNSFNQMFIKDGRKQNFKTRKNGTEKFKHDKEMKTFSMEIT